MNVQTAQRLAELRRTKGYSQEELAQRLGLSRQAISKWERAESSPDTDNLIALARLYSVSLDELVGAPFGGTAEDLVEEAAAATRETTRERARDEEQLRVERERAERALSAVTEASAAAAQAAQAAAAAASRADTPERIPLPESRFRTNRADGRPSRRRGTLSSFPYGIFTVILFFAIGIIWSFDWAWLVFLTIPIFRWIAGVIEDDLDRSRADEEVPR
ncbi:helix-turn-helix domain protein [Coriobacterium glomerans PW2]|uniref:Helix-turn-helix domain protein n=1 Tax=Coriobacterium glomerans (strain ATCC 49209 / DSM 20642 / JCM 10262 / PW2) TaxID=700015 RepID=F2N8S5_CORGP|nr:helix-turn-helix transcriptional regulator [Coriobacterium glomerans]AEB07458.1 helix-turn-helix domain protein [Coriobacterium glomerans PW2]